MVAALVLLLLAPENEVQDAELKARQALTEGRPAEALEHFEEAIRAAGDTPTKLRLRDDYRAVGWAEPRPTNQAEDLTLAVHIRNEKLRVLTKAAERFEKDDWLHAAIILRHAIQQRPPRS